MKIAIVGAGKLGVKIAEALLGGDYSVTVIDKDEEILQKLSTQMDIMTVNENAKQISVLKDINIGSYEYLIAVTDRDEKNIVIASFAKRLGCTHVIARVRDPEHMNQIDFIKDTMSIDYIVNPDLSISMAIYKYLVEKYTLSNGIFSSGKIALLELKAEKMPALIGAGKVEFKKLLPRMLTVALSRNGKIIIPRGDTVIQADDELYVVGEKEPILALSAKVLEKGKYTNIRKVMVVGGGKTGLYLSAKLSEFGAAVKIIESNKARCHYLSTHLSNVMILHGDATDISLLEEEGIEEMDAFITATGYDEENLLLALMAKKHGIEDVIAKISRDSYAGLIENMGVDMALNPQDIITSNVLRYIQGSQRILSSQLIQGQAEIIEVLATEHMKMLDTPLRQLKLPEGIIIAAIHRGTQAIIPDGGTQIKKGDRVIIIFLLSELPALEKLFRSTGRLGIF